jgi:hypothetical protein
MRIPDTGGGKPKQYGSNFKPIGGNIGVLAQNSSVPAALLKKPSGGGGSRALRYNPPSQGNNSRSYGGGGGSVGRSSFNGGGSAPAAPKPTPPPNLWQYLRGDTTYQDQVSQLRKAYSDYLASQNNDKTQYETQYGLGVKNLGQDRTKSFDDLLNDYAGRGLLNSGVYGQAYSDLQSQYDSRQTQLDAQRKSFLDDLATNLTNFRGDQQTTQTSAKQEAIARRAAKYGI